MSKILLIQPPQWYPVSPYLAVPLLTGQLKAARFDAYACDLNAQFYNDILTCEHAKRCDEEARKILLESEIKIIIGVGEGAGSAIAWGCDLTYDYVKINGDYRT